MKKLEETEIAEWTKAKRAKRSPIDSMLEIR